MHEHKNQQPVPVDTISKKLLLQFRNDVAPGANALILWQDPLFVGFIKMNDNMEIQPEGPEKLSFNLLQDFRMIGPLGEWHLWRQPGEQFRARLRLKKHLDDKQDINQQYYLWGTKRCPHHEDRVPGWSCVTEERGMRIWLPLAVTDTLPVSLSVCHIVEQDDSGLAAVVDSLFILPEQWEEE